MSSVSIYLNFARETEQAFNFYKSVFGGEFQGGIMRFSDVPASEKMPPLPEEELKLVMHVSLPIIGGFMLMGSDAPQSMGFRVNSGNSVYINLMPDTREETQRLFEALSEGGIIEQELQDMFWGDYYGSFRDRFGTQWMINCAKKAE
jgi:PhnB protein